MSEKKPSKGNQPTPLGEAIKAAREARGWSQAKLAQAASTSQQTVNRIELGKTTHSRALNKIIDLLDIGTEVIFESLGFSRQDDDGLDFNSAPTLPKTATRDVDEWIPVYGSHFSGNMVSDDPVSFVNTPEPLINVRGAYGMIVSGIDMIPALRSGDTALINPHIPPREGDDVLLRSHDKMRVRFGTLLHSDEEKIRFHTWNPRTDHEVARLGWPVCHLVVGKFSRS